MASIGFQPPALVPAMPAMLASPRPAARSPLLPEFPAKLLEDNAPAFLGNPSGFIQLHPIALADLSPASLTARNNLRARFTLTTSALDERSAARAMPTLRLQTGNGLTGIDALYCRLGGTGEAFDALPYCDIAAVPGHTDPMVLFTTGMNGSTLVVATEVPASAAPLAPGRWRVMHDADHRSLAQWHAAGYMLRFAAYVDGAAGAGAMPPWPSAAVVANYNPNGYPLAIAGGQSQLQGLRVVTNFLWWSGANWTFNSRHVARVGVNTYDLDAIAPGGTSTQSLVI